MADLSTVLTKDESAAPLPVSPGSQRALATLNRQRVLNALTSVGPSTQVMLSRNTGLSSATVSNVVHRLRGEGQVRTSHTTISGRRAILVELHSRVGAVVGLEFSRGLMKTVLTTPGSGVIARRSVLHADRDDAGPSLDALRLILDHLLQETQLRTSDIVGLGAAMPGPIDRRTGTLSGPDRPEGWKGINAQSTLQSLLKLPVAVDSAANLGALAHARHRPCRNLLYVCIDETVTAGLVLNGEVHGGHLGLADQIGHTGIAGHGLPCRCGNRDCLNTVASTGAILHALRRSGASGTTTERLVDRALAGDAAILRFIRDATETTGRVVADTVNLINPQRIVLGGPLAVLGPLLLEPFSRGLLRYTVPEIGETTEVTVNALGAAVLAARAYAEAMH